MPLGHKFAHRVETVIAVDIEASKLHNLIHNAGIYGVANRILPLCMRMEEANRIRGDFCFCSPPWGGISYITSDLYSVAK